MPTQSFGHSPARTECAYLRPPARRRGCIRLRATLAVAHRGPVDWLRSDRHGREDSAHWTSCGPTSATSIVVVSLADRVRRAGVCRMLERPPLKVAEEDASSMGLQAHEPWLL